MSDCIFCKITNGDIPCYKIYENAKTLAFLDISNDCNGHILVIPKTHYENILDCPDSILSEVMQTVKKVSAHLVNNCGFDGINVLNANGVYAEQTVFHLHFHILPRQIGDGINLSPKLEKNKDSLENIAKKLRLN